MLATLTTRPATIADIPFLARIVYEASRPPFDHCVWEDLLEGTDTPVLEFLAAKFQAAASNWGNVENFLILEEQGTPVAAAAGYAPDDQEYRPLRLSRLPAIAETLQWSTEDTELFRDRYLALFGREARPFFLTPQAAWIIEYVAVIPSARGRGLGKALVKALLEKGQAMHYEFAGIMVINGNDAARHTYEAIGFKPYQTFHADYFLEQFGMEFPGLTKFGLRLN